MCNCIHTSHMEPSAYIRPNVECFVSESFIAFLLTVAFDYVNALPDAFDL